jgi:hypothetical protein
MQPHANIAQGLKFRVLKCKFVLFVESWIFEFFLNFFYMWFYKIEPSM